MKGQDIATEHFDYKPFGDTLNATDESRIGYAAQERDEESRYFAMGARQYDPISGRFLSVDPLYESFPDKTPYHYCNNNPISFKDPSGLSPEGEKGKEDEVQVVYTIDLSQSYELLLATQESMEEARNTQKMFNLRFISAFNFLTNTELNWMDNFWGDGGGGAGSGGSTANYWGIRDKQGGLRVNGSKSAKSKFQSVVNTGTGGHYSADIDKNGQVTLVKNDDGEMTDGQQAFYDVMAEATDRSQKGVTIELIEWGDSKGRDHYILAGSYFDQIIDIDDVIAFGSNGIMTSASIFGHEIAEQTKKQRNEGREGSYKIAHRKACMVESDICGYRRVEMGNWSFDKSNLDIYDNGTLDVTYTILGTGLKFIETLYLFKGNLMFHETVTIKRNFLKQGP